MKRKRQTSMSEYADNAVEDWISQQRRWLYEMGRDSGVAYDIDIEIPEEEEVGSQNEEVDIEQNEEEEEEDQEYDVDIADHGESPTIQQFISGNRKSCGSTSATRDGSNNVITLTDSRLLDCPICFEPLTIPVFQCDQNGHIACSSCRTKLNNKCPSCACPIDSNRCRAIENVVESNTTQCQNIKYGCNTPVAYNKKIEHEKTCVCSPCFCPFSGCHFFSSTKELYQHCRNNHEVLEYPEDCSLRIILQKNVAALVLGDCMDTLFILRNRVEVLGNVVTLSCIQPRFMDDFQYDIVVENNGSSLKFQSMTTSSRYKEIGSGDGTYASSYNYSITTECLKDPLEALYGGGILVNPEFNHNIEGWILFGEGKIEERISNEGNRFLVAHSRKDSLAGFSQKVQVEEGKIYSFSASVQISEGSEVVAVVFKFPSGEGVPGGYVIAEHGCWILLKGGIVANFTSPVDILFENKNTSVDIWLDNVSLQPFTKEEWKAHQDKSINEVRKRKVRIQVSRGKLALRSANVSIKQIKSDFPFGCAMNRNILTSSDYQSWFTSRFKFTTFTNEMKWYSTEKIRGQENYTTADGMVKFAIQNTISIRGHNVFWDDPRMQPSWLNNSLPAEEILIEAAKRISSVIPRYRGQLIAWDVVNENLHFRFFEDKTSENASGAFYYAAQQLDPDTIMFMNEYATIEYSLDEKASPVQYKKKFQEILSYPGNANLSAGIGLQGHFGTGQPNLAYMRSALDILGAMGFPVWLTEVDVAKHENQSQYLEEVLREGFSHPAVQGIIMFVGPETAGFNVTTLADKNFQNTPSGDVVDKLIAEWSGNLETTTNDQGFIDVPLFHGDYEVTAEDPNNKSSATLSLTVTKYEPQEIVNVQIYNT